MREGGRGKERREDNLYREGQRARAWENTSNILIHKDR